MAMISRTALIHKYLLCDIDFEIFLFSGQSQLPVVNSAIGQPFNPSYTTIGLLPFENGGMNLVQRCLNTYFSFVFEHIFRNMYILGQVNGLLDRHFPGQVRPDLLALERNVSVAFSFGHPLILDGWSPMAPNYGQLGKYF